MPEIPERKKTDCNPSQEVAEQLGEMEQDLSQEDCVGGQGLSKADFVAACIALRGCAAHVVNRLEEDVRRRKLETWLEYPRIYLAGKQTSEARKGGDDFFVRWNAAVSISYLYGCDIH